MPGDEGVEKSSGTESDPSGTSAPAAAFRSVFLSYASHDAERTNKACQSLETHGISCWLAPRDVKPGTQCADAIVRFVEENEIQVLNVAGPRASGWVAGYRFALDVVSGVIRDEGSIDLAADRTP